MKRFATSMSLHSLNVLCVMIVNILMLQEGLSGTNEMTLQNISGQLPYAGFGYSVASAGDVNGDGYADIIVGNYSSAGNAYVFFGGPVLDTIPDVTLISRMSNDRFGLSAAGVGDVNGDGYADVIVGARQSGPLGTDSGHAYIYFGGVAMDSVPDVIVAGAPGELFGCSVACAGDVNNDGYRDIIIGAYGSDAAGLDVGRAYIFFGGAIVDNIPDVIITGSLPTEDLGNSVASAGDVNNDGYDDVIVGAYAYDVVNGNCSGRAYLYLGGSPMNNMADVVFSGLAVNWDYFGTCVAGAGDVNGDGYDDVLVSAQENSARGRTSLYLGGSPMNNIADLTFNGEAINNNFGYSAGGAGDVNGDGYADVIIGAFRNYGSTGKAYIYNGGVAMDTIPDLTLLGETAGDYFGISVARAGDVNGDGNDDMIVGAYHNGGATYPGRVYVYLSSNGPLPIQLGSFTATIVGQEGVRLDWTTISELNNYGFEVQRKQSTESQFALLPNGFIPGHGTTNEPQQYLYVDAEAQAGEWHYRLKQIDLDGTAHYSDGVTINVLTGVSGSQLPDKFSLSQNYPNPFNPTTTIRYDLPVDTRVSLKMFNILGQEVITLVNEEQKAGYKSVGWNAINFSSGVYYYRLQAGEFVQAKRLLILK